MLLNHNRWTWTAIYAGQFVSGWPAVGCVIYFFFVLFAFGRRGIAHPVSLAIEAYGIIELLWYFVWFLPYKTRLQRPGMPMTPLSRAERRVLISRALSNVPDVRMFVRKWFCMAHIDQIYRESVRDWLGWALWAKPLCELRRDEYDELDEYIDEAQELGGIILPPGRADGNPIRLNQEPVRMLHRSLLWYGLMAIVDIAGVGIYLLRGFTFYRQPRKTFFQIFPFRPWTLLCPKESASPELSYVYRRGTSKTHRPVVFLHGIGVGIPTYATWLPTLPKELSVLAVEIMSVANRIAPEGMPARNFADGVNKILVQQGIEDFVFVSHSYGTMMARPLLDHPLVGPKINSMILCDPVSILLHLPEVAYNVTRRVPSDTPQLEIDYGAGRDPMTAHTLCRRFHWPEHVLFREHMEGKRTTAIVASRDCVMPGPTVASYMYYGHVHTSPADVEELRKVDFSRWTGQADIELVYLHDRDHGQSLLIPHLAVQVSKVVMSYADKSIALQPMEHADTEPKASASTGYWRQQVAPRYARHDNNSREWRDESSLAQNAREVV